MPGRPGAAHSTSVRRSVPPHRRHVPVTCAYGNTPPAAPTASPEAGPGRPYSPLSFPPSRRRHHGNGAVPLRGGAGVTLPAAALTAGHRRQREPRGAGPGQKLRQGRENWRGRGAPEQRSGEEGEEARWSRPASSPCHCCFRALIMGD